MAITPVTMNKITFATPAPAATTPSTTNSTKDIQTQLVGKQQHLKQVSSDDTITATEKEEKRRQLQKEIEELKRKLELEKQEAKEKAEDTAKKQRKEALRKEELLEDTLLHEENKKDSSEAKTHRALGAQPTDDFKEAQQKADIEVKELQQMLSADYLIQKERVQEQVDAQIESTIHVLKSEIKQDKIYGADTKKKEVELETLQQKEQFWSDAQKVQESQQQQTVQAQPLMNANAQIVIDQI